VRRYKRLKSLINDLNVILSKGCTGNFEGHPHKPENYGKWTINIEIKEGEKGKKRGEGNREMGEKIQK